MEFVIGSIIDYWVLSLIFFFVLLEQTHPQQRSPRQHRRALNLERGPDAHDEKHRCVCIYIYICIIYIYMYGCMSLSLYVYVYVHI